jgi:predicted lysophospholipase L1 biosynthesis ABC-type transport system permease subunit
MTATVPMVRRRRPPIAGTAVAVAIGVGFSVLLISLSLGVSRSIKTRLAGANSTHPALLNVPRIDAILTDLTVVVTAAMLIQTAVSTYVLGRSTMSTRRDEIAIRRQSGVLRSTLVLEFLVGVLRACLIGGVIGEGAGIGATLAVRHFSSLPAHFTWLSVLGAFPTAVILAIGATLIPAWRTANVSPALVRRS